MFSKNMQAIYSRLFILGLLSMCLVMFGYTNASENVSAAAALCTVDCTDNQNRCNDTCDTLCSADSTDEDCNSCLGNCEDQWFSCMSHAVTCSRSPVYNQRCEVNYGQHCVVIGGVTSCDPNDGAHNGYSEVCDRNGFQCVSCPDHEYCWTNTMPPCF